MNYIKIIIFIISTTLLFSCATMPPLASLPDEPAVAAITEPVNTWEQRVTTLNRIQHWTIQGSLSVRTPENADSASLYWQQNRSNYQMRLIGPIGVGQVQITGNPEGVTLRTSQGDSAQAPTPEQLLLEQTGWRVPVRHLFWWVRGLPNPNQAHTKQLDDQQRITTLVQDGWVIQYESYRKVKGYDLPRKMRLTHGELQVIIAIRSWKI